jgi:hypothetical protein
MSLASSKEHEMGNLLQKSIFLNGKRWTTPGGL